MKELISSFLTRLSFSLCFVNRLAMLAAAGWPISELFDKKLANWVGMTPLVDASDRAPSLLNGGLGKVSPVYWIVVLAAAGAIDFYGISKSSKNDPSYFAGNLGFDPLGLYPKDKAGQERMQLAELKNGRLGKSFHRHEARWSPRIVQKLTGRHFDAIFTGMIAITAFAFQEFVTKLGVTDETPIFFKPLGQALHEVANAGYYIPN